MTDDASLDAVVAAGRDPETDAVDLDLDTVADDAEIEALDFAVGVSEVDRDDLDRLDASSATGVRVVSRGPAGHPKVRRSKSGAPRRAARLRRRLAGAFVVMVGLAMMGGVFSMFAATSTAQSTATGDVSVGRQLFSVSCITCHGANLQGVKNKGPALNGVGGASVYFQVSTGRMPIVGQGADATRKPSIYTDVEVRALAAYVQSLGGGNSIPTGNLRDDAQLAQGGELFRLNCASCHNFAGKGAALSAGKYAPSLNKSTDLQIATAMLSGPENMPVFSDNQLTPTQKHEIIAYIQTLKASKDPGGNGLDRIGPVTEGLVVWVVGIGALMLVILWIGAKS